jgi:hypothetical protein
MHSATTAQQHKYCDSGGSTNLLLLWLSVQFLLQAPSVSVTHTHTHTGMPLSTKFSHRPVKQIESREALGYSPQSEIMSEAKNVGYLGADAPHSFYGLCLEQPKTFWRQKKRSIGSS